jgi:hypothetical protein
MRQANISQLTLPNVPMASSKSESRTQGKQPRSAAWRTEFFGLPQLAFVLPYVALLVWFHEVDVYHRHFAEPGLIVVAYNCFRVFFIFYLFWIAATAGLLLLRAVARQELAELGVLERLALSFFTGAGVWHVAMLALGYLDLYTLPVAIAVTLPLVVLSYVPARAAACDIYHAVITLRGLDGLDWLLLALAAIAIIMLLLVKGLHPGGGHDYFTHYFYYLQAVIERGGLWPNDVWYHYYYDKGAGLVFLGVLLTDLLAPQLVTFTFMVAAGLALFLLLRRIAPATLWPLAGTVLFLFVYIYTPGAAVLYSMNGGWGDFEKLHEINAALVIAIVWMTVEALTSTDRKRILWFIAATSTIVCAVLTNITIAIYLGGFFALLAVCYAVCRRIASVLICLGLGAVAGFLLIALLIINQATTGLANDQGILFFWNFANIETLAGWGALPFVIVLFQGRQQMVGATPPFSIHTVIFLIESFRLDLVMPMIIGGTVISLSAIVRSRWNRNVITTVIVLTSAALMFLAVAMLAGRAQQVSFYRYASFGTPLAIACAVLSWSIPSGDDRTARFARSRPIALLVLLLCLVLDLYPAPMIGGLNRALHFASGRYSIDTAYSTQYGPPPRQEWSAIYTGARGAYGVVGPGTPIWSLHIHTYCMLPNCIVESYPSFLMTHHWERVMFGTPNEAEQTLHAAHLDYFLFTREDDIRDPLPLSPLFSPDNIGQFLGIRWTDGTTSLLTWLGPGIAPLDQAWIADYRRSVERSATVQSFPYAAMKQILAGLDATPHPWRALRLPWQGD